MAFLKKKRPKWSLLEEEPGCVKKRNSKTNAI